MRALVRGGVHRREERGGDRSSTLRRSPAVRLIVDSFHAAPGLFAGAVVASLVAGVMPLVVAIQSGRVVELATRAIGRGRGSPEIDTAFRAAVFLAAFYFASQALLGIRSALGEAAGRALSGVALVRMLAAATKPAPVDHLVDPRVAALVGRARGVGSIEVLPGDGTASLVSKLSAWTGNLGAALFLGWLRWWVGGAAIVLFASSYIVIVRGYRDIVVGSRDEAGTLRRTAYLRDVVVTSPAAKEVRVFGLTDFFVRRFLDSWDTTRRELAKVRFQTEWVSFAVSAVVALAYLAVFGVLGADAAAGRISVAQIAAAVLAIGVLTNGILPGRDDLNIGWGAASLAAVRELEGSVGSTSSPPTTSSGVGPAKVACRDVSYTYPNGRRVFDQLNIELEAGESVAIVGENGAGKTTLARIIAGLSLPEHGVLVVDGHEVTAARLRNWQRQVVELSPSGGQVVMTLDGTAVPTRAVGGSRGCCAASWCCTS